MPEQNENLENLKNNSSSWGGAREGAGRPEGVENPANKVQRAAMKRFRERVNEDIDKLYNAQRVLALGHHILIKQMINPETKQRYGKAVIVNDEAEILAYFNGEYDQDHIYYEVVAVRPMNSAIDSMLDRAYGKAKETVELIDDQPKRIVMEIVDTREPKPENPEETTNESN